MSLVSKNLRKELTRFYCSCKSKPENIIFIDNELPNVTAAKEVGIDAIHFTNADQLRRDLYDRGINVELPANKTTIKPSRSESI